MDPMGICNLVKFLFSVCPASHARTSKMTACVQCVFDSLNDNHQTPIQEIVTICRFCSEWWKTRDKHAIFTYNMLRVVKLYDLYCLNALILFEMVPFQVAQAACGTISYCQNLCFRFEIPWCALSCHKLNGENGVGPDIVLKGWHCPKKPGIFEWAEKHASGFVDMLHCCDLFSRPKTWVVHVQSISHCCLLQLYSGKFSLVQWTEWLGWCTSRLNGMPKKIKEHQTSRILHPGRLTWNMIMEVWKITLLSKWVIGRFHVNLPGRRIITPKSKGRYANPAVWYKGAIHKPRDALIWQVFDRFRVETNNICRKKGLAKKVG